MGVEGRGGRNSGVEGGMDVGRNRDDICGY